MNPPYVSDSIEGLIWDVISTQLDPVEKKTSPKSISLYIYIYIYIYIISEYNHKYVKEIG